MGRGGKTTQQAAGQEAGLSGGQPLARASEPRAGPHVRKSERAVGWAEAGGRHPHACPGRRAGWGRRCNTPRFSPRGARPRGLRSIARSGAPRASWRREARGEPPAGAGPGPRARASVEQSLRFCTYEV